MTGLHRFHDRLSILGVFID